MVITKATADTAFKTFKEEKTINPVIAVDNSADLLIGINKSLGDKFIFLKYLKDKN